MRRIKKNRPINAAITTTGTTTAIATIAPVERLLLPVELLDAAAAVAAAMADPLVADEAALVAAGNESDEDPAGCVVDVDWLVLVLRSDSCQRICTLKAFTASRVPTEKVDVKVELLVAITVRESEASVPSGRTHPYEVAKKRLLT